MRVPSPQKRYLVRLAVLMTGYTFSLFLAIRLIRDEHVQGPLAWILAFLPGLCVAGVFWAIGRLIIEEQDEYQRMLLVRQVLVATGFTLTIVTIYGFLENFGLVAHVDGFYVAVLWFIGLGIGSATTRLTLGTSGRCCWITASRCCARRAAGASRIWPPGSRFRARASMRSRPAATTPRCPWRSGSPKSLS